ncbi:Linker histone H1/H5 [Macleaya cordata]|uniref:Linker histone H1/H5 n=1 Tax=Macleaya cordata TaxID=56857 RepID=A0A200PWI7_MACCD|nr:Linker histone H1/H5 [Macleaya cordata]
MAKKVVPSSTAKSNQVPEKKSKTVSKPMKNPSPPHHPPYFQMITEAISSLKERTGSSQQAIAKFIEEKYLDGLPPNFKKVLSVQLKKFSKSERLVKVKNSFKISATEKAKRVAVEIKEKTKKTEKKKEEAKTDLGKEKKSTKVKTKSENVVSIPKSKTVKKETVKAGGKMKRLSQVKTPEGLKKVLTPKKKALMVKKARV